MAFEDYWELVLLGVDGLIAYGFYKAYKNITSSADVIEKTRAYTVGPELHSIVNETPDKCLPYIGISGIARISKDKFLKSNNANCVGLVHESAIIEHKSKRLQGVWSDVTSKVSSIVRASRFGIASPESFPHGVSVANAVNFIEVSDPLSSDFLLDSLPIIYNSFKPSDESFFTKCFDRFFGEVVRGYQFTEKMLPEGTPITAIGRVYLTSSNTSGKSGLVIGPPDTSEHRITGSLRKSWLEFLACKEEQDDRLNSLVKMFSQVEHMIERIESYCGTYQLFWKVKNFNKALSEARDGTRPVVQSPVFDSHRNGYKLQLSLCPVGEGKARNEAMSLFFSILKGNADSFLPWPFACPIKFTLLNQKLLKQQQSQEINKSDDVEKENSRNKDPLKKVTSASSRSFSLTRKGKTSAGGGSNESREKSGFIKANSADDENKMCSSDSNLSAKIRTNKFEDHSMVFNPMSHPANEVFLQRPSEDKNRSVGFQKFILLSDLLEGGFVDKDMIFIKVHVDVSKV